MGITFAYELRLKKNLYENHLLKKLHPNSTGRTPLKTLRIPKKTNRTKITGLLRSRGQKIEKNSNLLMAHHLLDAPPVIEKKSKNKFRLPKNIFEKMFKI